MPNFNEHEIVRLDAREIRGGTLVLRRLRPPMTESRLGDAWVETEIPGIDTQLLPVARKGALGGYEVSGLSRWYRQQGIQPGDKLVASLGPFGLSLSRAGNAIISA